MGHREDIRQYLETESVGGVVHDWGSGSKPVEKYVRAEPGCEFIRIDKADNDDWPPHYKADIQRPIKIAQRADHAFCMEVLEHTPYPLPVLRNIYANLKKNGSLHLSVPFLYPEHGDADYLRLTRTGLWYYLTDADFREINIIEITEGFIARARK